MSLTEKLPLLKVQITLRMISFMFIINMIFRTVTKDEAIFTSIRESIIVMIFAYFFLWLSSKVWNFLLLQYFDDRNMTHDGSTHIIG